MDASAQSSAMVVLVGVDGSSNSERAIAVAAQLGRALDAEVVAVHAVGLITEIDGVPVPGESYREAIEGRVREQWCARLAADAALRWRAEIEFGDPAEVLIRLADRLHPAYVVVGSRGHGELASELLGSTSHHVVHHCTYPVVVVPPDAPVPPPPT